MIIPLLAGMAAALVLVSALVYAIHCQRRAARAAKTMRDDAELRQAQWADEHRARVEAEAEVSRLDVLTTQEQRKHMPARVAKVPKKPAHKTKGGKS